MRYKGITKVIITILFIGCAIVAMFLVIGSSSSDVIKQYDSIKPDRTSGLTSNIKFLQTYVQSTGDASVVSNITGLSSDDVNTIYAGTSLGNTSTSTDIAISTNGIPNEPVDTPTTQIVAMSEEEKWLLISGGVYRSYDEANAGGLDFWKTYASTLTTTITVKVHTSLTTDGQKTVVVNKAMVTFWTEFMDDLYNLGYIVTGDFGGYNVRLKNNSSSTKSISSHSFGTTLDFNWNVDGMGSVSAGIGQGIPYVYNGTAYSNLSDEHKMQICAVNSPWDSLRKKYGLNWGGYWSYNYLDPMHFSLVGDGDSPSSPKASSYLLK